MLKVLICGYTISYVESLIIKNATVVTVHDSIKISHKEWRSLCSKVPKI